MFKPLGKRVLLKKLEKETSIGGILIAEQYAKKQDKAKIIALGCCEGHEFSVKVDDIVLIEKYSGQEIDIDNQQYIIVNEDHLIGVLNE